MWAIEGFSHPGLAISEGIEGNGVAFYQRVVAEGLEGVVAKRLKSRYFPGKRSPAWIKIKRRERHFCAIIGFIPDGKDDFQSLILAIEEAGRLRVVGRVGTGIDGRLRAKQNALLWSRLRARPVVPCKLRGLWLEPGLFCWASCMEFSNHGEMRAPVFGELHVG